MFELGALTLDFDLPNLRSNVSCPNDMRPWRNWQTRQTKDLVPVLGRGGSNPLGRIDTFEPDRGVTSDRLSNRDTFLRILPYLWGHLSTPMRSNLGTIPARLAS